MLCFIGRLYLRHYFRAQPATEMIFSAVRAAGGFRINTPTPVRNRSQEREERDVDPE